MSINKPKAVAGIKIPDSKIAQQATELLLEHGSVFLYNHSLRSFCFASLNGTQIYPESRGGSTFQNDRST